jgi:hypothetical protein
VPRRPSGKLQYRSSPHRPSLDLRALLSSLLHLHLEIRRLTLPPLTASVSSLVWRIDDDSATREPAIEAVGTARVGSGGVSRAVAWGIGIIGVVAFGGVVGVCVVDVEGLAGWGVGGQG